MLLHEEYKNRHGLSYPVVRRPDPFMYLIYQKDGEGYTLLELKKIPQSHHPCYYQMTLYQPYRNNYRSLERSFGHPNGNDLPLSRVSDGIKVEWDQFDQEMIKWAIESYGQVNPMIGLPQIKMAVWEMFLITYDDAFSKISDHTTQYNMMKSIDVDLPIVDRMRAQIDIVNYIQYDPNFNGLFRSWAPFQTIHDPSHYAFWLIELADKLRDSTYRNEFGNFEAVA